MPVFDAMTSGYYIPSYAEVYSSYIEDSETGDMVPRLDWTSYVIPINTHSKIQFEEYPLSSQYDGSYAFKWMNHYGIKTPPGYSTLFVTPFHHSDLPFFCLPGIVDTDKYHLPVNFPFFLKKGFTGVIPLGTPMIQAIPFKRDDWESVVNEHIPLEQNKRLLTFKQSVIHSYKNKYRSKKAFK